MMKKKSTSNNLPTIGMGVTIQGWSDRHAGTIIQILQGGRKLVIQMDIATRIDNNGMSESQQYTYQPDPNGAIQFATLRKDSKYRVMGGKSPVALGIRNEYYDFSF